MTSYQTSAIASSDEEDEIVPDSIGLIITTPPPALSTEDFQADKDRYYNDVDDDDDDPYAVRDELPSHPLFDQSLWSFPVIRAVCQVTSTSREYDPDSLHALASVAMDLIDRGAVVIVTGTGFSSMQRDLAAKLPVPVLCSAMVQLSSLKLVTSGGVGVVTLDRQLVSAWNLVAVGAAPDTPVIGLSPTSLWRQDFDCSGETSRLLYDLVEACTELVSRHQVTSIVLEEPTFAPFTARIQERLRDVRIFDVVTAVSWLYGGHRQSGMSPDRQRQLARGDRAGGGGGIGEASSSAAAAVAAARRGSRNGFMRRYDEERVEDASIISDTSSPIVGSRRAMLGL